MNWVLYVLSPAIVHLVISEGTAILAGNALDSAACTALSSAVVLPAALRMYRQDRGLHGSDASFFAGLTHGSKQGWWNAKSSIRSAVREKNGDGIRTVNRSLQLLFLLLCFIGGGLLNFIWSGLMNRMGISQFFSNETQQELLSGGIAMQLLGPGLLVPIAEELVFRGLCYPRMKTRLSIGQSVLFSALLFALFHGNPIQMIYAFPMALVLALLYETGGTLAGPVLFHMGANLLTILLA